jgi:hypothetical protein
MALPETPRAPPHACSALAPAGQLLIWSLEGWASARIAGDAPHGPLGAVLTAKTSARAAALFIAWIQAIEAARLRPIRAHALTAAGRRRTCSSWSPRAGSRRWRCGRASA